LGRDARAPLGFFGEDAGKGQEHMVKVDIKEEEKCRRTLEVELPPEQARQHREEVVSELRKKIVMPGFRKGKAPRDLIEQRHQDSIKDEFYQKAVARAYREALLETKLRPVTNPKFEDIRYVEGGPLKFKATFEVMPVIETDLSRLDGLEIIGEVYEIGDADVAAELKKIQDSQATFNDVDRESASGDYLVIDYQKSHPETGELSGERNKDFTLELGSSSLLPEFAEALTGAKKGESKTVEVNYPDDFANKELAGQKVSYLVEIKEIREKLLPDLDDKFARRVSEYATMEQLKTRILDNLKAEEAVASRRRLEEKLLDELLSKYPFDAPDSLVDSLGAQFVDQMTQGAELDDKEKEDLRDRYRPQVVRRVQRDLLIDLIAEREGIQVTDREVGLEIRRMKDTGELRPAVDEEELSGRVKDRIQAKKTVDMLMDRADVKLETKPRPQVQGGSQ
jgi:trigger factor